MAIDKLRQLADLARQVSPADLQRFRERAENVEKLLEDIARTLKRIEKCLCSSKK